MLESAFDILGELENVSSRNEKEELLRMSEDNEILKTLLYRAFNPFMKFYVVKYGEVNPSGEGVSMERYEKFLELTEHLSNRVFTGHEALSIVQHFFNECSELEWKWYDRVLKKDMKIGVTEKTVNKVWKNHIPVFECMLAKPWEKVKKKPNTVYVEPKLDGYRALSFVYNDGTVEIYTRNGKLIEGFAELEEELALLPKGYVYDAEITGKENAFNDMQKSVFNKSNKNKQGILNVFDIIPIKEFEAGKSKAKMPERIEQLENIIREHHSKHGVKNIVKVEISGPMKPDDPKVDELYQHYLNEGYEGIMVKDSQAIYECKRTNSWAKIKPTDTFDLEIVGYEEGEGKNEGKLGAFIVEYNGHKVNVGSGYSDAMREDFWARRNELIGAIIEVEAQEVTTNQKGGESLRFPIFKQIRVDKS